MPKSTAISNEQAYLKIKESFPSSDFSILEYSVASSPIKCKCNKCGKIIQKNKLYSLLGQVNFCSCDKYFKNTKEKVLFLLEKNNFSLIEWKRSDKKVKIKCNNCQKIIERFPLEIFKNPAFCSECNNSQTQPLSKEKIQEKIDNVFSNDKYLLLDYENWQTKVHIKHLKCGTIFLQNIGHFLDGCGCPKCYKKRSKGEQLISSWLDNNFIKYETQVKINYPDNTRGYFDFYIKEKKLAIEYNGEQHYIEENSFNKKNGFQKQVERDNKKRDYCKNNNISLLEIPYWDKDKIFDILQLQFNDYPTGVELSSSKCLTSKDEDIV